MWRNVTPLFPEVERRAGPSSSLASLPLDPGVPAGALVPPCASATSFPVGVEICQRCELVYAADLRTGLCECCQEQLLDLKLGLARGDLS